MKISLTQAHPRALWLSSKATDVCRKRESSANGGIEAWPREGGVGTVQVMVSNRTRRRRNDKSVVATRTSGVFDASARVAQRGSTRAEAPAADADSPDGSLVRGRLRG